MPGVGQQSYKTLALGKSEGSGVQSHPQLPNEFKVSSTRGRGNKVMPVECLAPCLAWGRGSESIPDNAGHHPTELSPLECVSSYGALQRPMRRVWGAPRDELPSGL